MISEEVSLGSTTPGTHWRELHFRTTKNSWRMTKMEPIIRTETLENNLFCPRLIFIHLDFERLIIWFLFLIELCRLARFPSLPLTVHTAMRYLLIFFSGEEEAVIVMEIHLIRGRRFRLPRPTTSLIWSTSWNISNKLRYNTSSCGVSKDFHLLIMGEI